MVKENFNEKVKSEARCGEGGEGCGRGSGWQRGLDSEGGGKPRRFWAERGGVWAFTQGGLVLRTFTWLLICGHERELTASTFYDGRILPFTSVARDGFLDGKLNSFEVLAPLARLFPRKCFFVLF